MIWVLCFVVHAFVFFKQKTAYEMRISDWSSDVCSSDLGKPWYWSTRPVRDLSSEDPVKRFAAVVARDGWCLEVFGLIRAEALRRTSLIGRYYGSDKVLLAELGTMGRFRTRGDPLFLRGCQPQQSTYLTPQEQARWIRGTAAGIRFDQANILFGCLGAALRRSLTPVERLRCLGWVLRRAARMEKLKRDRKSTRLNSSH